MKQLPIVAAALVLLMLSGCIFPGGYWGRHHHEHDDGYGQNQGQGDYHDQHPQGDH